MIQQNTHKLLAAVILLFLTGFALVACNAVDTLLPTTNEDSGSVIIESQTAVSQDANDDAQNVSAGWNAATFFGTTCASCHGPTGGGTAVAPALNSETIQTADLDWLIETIRYGRTGTAMPAWSVESGGSLTSEQIAEMAVFLQAGSDWEAAGEIAAEQPDAPMGPGMMGGGMMGGNGMMGRGMGNGRIP